MPWKMPYHEGEWDGLHVEVRDTRRVLAALDGTCTRHEMALAPPAEQLPHGRWLLGEEDPTTLRFLVSPAGPRWTTVFASALDWHLEWSSEMAALLGCRAAYAMLNDGDVFSLHLFDGPAYVAGYVSSPIFFDLPPRPEGDLGVDPEAVLAFCRPGTTLDEVRAALAPPGAIDIDGTRAFLRTAELLELPEHARSSYRWSLQQDGLTPRPERADWEHRVYRLRRDDAEEAPTEAEESQPAEAKPLPGGGVVLPFRTGRRGPSRT